ncbi:MAG: hypothetical protein OXC01_19475 [Immundisolibacterales bacterium]|nr:hypothetical protein [Immundisolibacterales bacterium]
MTTGPVVRAGFAPVIVAAVGVAGFSLLPGVVEAAAAKEGVTAGAVVAMADTEEYCTGYEHTFHGEWSGRDDGDGSGRPVLFRIGVSAGGKGCYAQLNVRTPPGVAPYELPRFRADAGGDGSWTLRYRDTVLEVDAATGTAVRRRGGEAPQPGTLLAHAPAVGDPPSAPPAGERARWYGKWRGRLSGVPFRVTLRFTESGSGTVKGRVTSLLMRRSFTGRFHGGMLVFRWRNRHVGLVMQPGGDTLVYHDYKGRVYRFRRRG